MARVLMALELVATCVGQPAIARAQNHEAAPPPSLAPPPEMAPPAELAPPPEIAPCSCCNCGALPPDLSSVDPALVNGPSEAELRGALAGGIAALAASYALGVLVAWREPHTNVVVDRLPIIGAVAAAARNVQDDENVPLLLFSAGVQAMSVMLIAAASSDLAALHRLQIAVGAGPGGCGLTIGGRFP